MQMTNSEKNPYRSPKSPSSTEELEPAKPLGCLATLFLANVIGIGIAVIVGETLTFFVLLPPMNRWFSMNGEFDGLILIGMPMWASGFSLITATIFGILYPRRFSSGIAIAVGLGLIAAFFWNIAKTANRPSEWYSALTVSVILLIAVAAGVMIAHRGLNRISRVRAMPKPDPETQKTKQFRRRLLLVALTVLYGVVDSAVLWMVFQDAENLSLFPISLCGLVFGLAVIALCAYQSAARSDVRLLARICLTVLITSLSVTTYLWLRYVWFRAG
ncbi:hypothetical protein [Stieleria mannarensis]|uniref:hypothetical protein n=1 Tax=Stieleria mannarensis TaxID=2755585 RepID=UPI001603ED33|nr:hypothetical protein [Rhodopirellula sp. JC639]